MRDHERRGRKHPIVNAVIDQGRRRQNARILGMVVVFFIVVIFIGAAFVSVIDHPPTQHHGVYFTVLTDRFTNDSGSWSYVTAIKNTGTVFIDSVAVTVPATGSTIGTLSSIPVGQTASGTFQISGVANNTLYMIEYYAVSGNLTYETTYPVTS